jgi:V-type H+-transporting ATPase subunit D
LKKVANKKQRDTAAADAEMKERRARLAEKNSEEGVASSSEPMDAVTGGDDEDVIF